MSSYLSQFNYQFIRGASGQTDPEDFRRPELRRFVFLHGLMGYGFNWRRIASGLEANDISLVFDQRGHGKSWKPLTGYSPQDYAEDLELIAREIGWDRFYLVGHSMGGRNALMYGARFPERVIKLVIEDIGPEESASATNYYTRLLGSIPTPFPTKLAAKEYFMNDFPKSPLAGRSPQTLGAYLYSNIIDLPDGTADWRFSRTSILASVAEGRAKDHWAELKSLSMPTLLVRGQNSNDLSQEVYEQMLAANSNLQGVVIPNAGHWAHSDQPQAFLEALLAFVAN